MKSFRQFFAEAKIDISKKAQLKSLADAYEHHIRQAAGQHDDEDEAKYHAREAQKYLKRISDNHGSDKALQLQKGVNARMEYEAEKSFD